MILSEELKEIENSNEFKNFKEKNNLSFLSSIFLQNKTPQFDFYNPESDKITSFIQKDNEIYKQESEIFRKEKIEIKELQLNKVKLSLRDITKLMLKLLEKYNQNPTKQFIVLQQEQSPVYNISYLTAEFKLLHVKINANSGEVVSENIESVLKFKTQ